MLSICQRVHVLDHVSRLDHPADRRAIQVALSTPLVALDQTFRLHSNPAGSRTMDLDFNGHTTSDTSWNNRTRRSSFDSPTCNADADASGFRSSELTTLPRPCVRSSWAASRS